MNLAYNKMRATELLKVLSKFGFEEVLKDFTRCDYEQWVYNACASREDVHCIEETDCYIFCDGDVEIYASSGASKVAFWTESDNCVFKMGFNKLRNDYCGLEADYFADAKRLGLDEFFAATEFVMWYGGVKVYVAERAEVSYERLSSDLYGRLESSGMEESEIRDTICEAEECGEFMNWLVPYYADSDKADEFFNFLNKSNINDLHSGNIGYIGERLVLIDYSGYRG